MRDLLSLTGMVIRSTPVGEYDKRLVLLTRERGKITAFARGARRPGSRLMGPSRLFAFGTYRLYEGREAYNLQDAEIKKYFEELSSDMEAACYGQYFLELSDWFSGENMDAGPQLLLLYQSLRALLSPAIPDCLVRRIFELKTMVVGGEYTERPPGKAGDAAAYAWEYVVTAPLGKLYTFRLSDEAFSEFSENVQAGLSRCTDREFRSLKLLEVLADRPPDPGF